MDFCKYMQYKDMWHALLKKKKTNFRNIYRTIHVCNHLLNHGFDLFFYTGQCANSYNQKDGRVQILGAFKSRFTY